MEEEIKDIKEEKKVEEKRCKICGKDPGEDGLHICGCCSECCECGEKI